MKRLIVALVLFLLATAAIAQDTSDTSPATKEDIQKYMDVMHSRDMMNQMLAAMTTSMHKMMHEQYLKDKDKLPAEFEDRTTRMMDDMFKNMPFDEMMQAMVPVYQKHFTKGDINSLLAFLLLTHRAKNVTRAPRNHERVNDSDDARNAEVLGIG